MRNFSIIFLTASNARQSVVKVEVDSYIFLFLPLPVPQELLLFENGLGKSWHTTDTLTIKTGQDSTLMLTLIKKENI